MASRGAVSKPDVRTFSTEERTSYVGNADKPVVSFLAIVRLKEETDFAKAINTSGNAAFKNQREAQLDPLFWLSAASLQILRGQAVEQFSIVACELTHVPEAQTVRDVYNSSLTI